MGIFSKLFSQPLELDALTRPHEVLASPFTGDSHLEHIVARDILGLDSAPLTRARAMQVPAVVKARALILGTLARQPLIKTTRGEQAEPEPWMYRSRFGGVHRRMAWTLDDHIFYGLSLWWLERGSRGEVLDAARVPFDSWEIQDGSVYLSGNRVPWSSVALIEGPQEGLLQLAGLSINGALAQEVAWTQRVTSPVPMVELHLTDQNYPMTKEEKQELAAEWEKQRQRGGTAVTPAEIEMKVHGTTSTDLFIQGRNSSRLDIANFLNVPASLLEGTTSTASLTYSTQEGRRNELVDLSLSYWATPIEERLSQDDIVPRSSAIQFDLEYMVSRDQLPLPTRED